MEFGVRPYPGDAAFSLVLQQLHIPMSIWDMRMYLLGLQLAPEYIPPFAALEEILLEGTPYECVFQSEEEHQEFISHYLGLWNHLLSYQGSSSRAPKLSPQKSDFKDKKDKISYINQKSSELMNFYVSIDEYGAGEYLDQCFDVFVAQAGLSILNDVLSAFALECDDRKGKVSDRRVGEMLEVIDELHRLWPETYIQLNALFQKIRRSELTLDSEIEMNRKMKEFLRSE